MRAAGFVLTGGKSTRMGTDKALLPYRGATLLEWVASQVKLAAGSVRIVGEAERYAAFALPGLAERYPGCGPLSGIEAALREGGAEWSLVTACDMPGLRADFLRRLLISALALRKGRGEVAVVAETVDGGLEPLCAAYHAKLLPDVRQALESGCLAVHKLLKKSMILRFPADSAGLVRSVNTMEEWAAWSR
jgi:molybdenum cofactor guanylyltransferase